MSSSDARVICSCSATAKKTRKYCRFIRPSHQILSVVMYMIQIIYVDNSRRGKELLADSFKFCPVPGIHSPRNIEQFGKAMSLEYGGGDAAALTAATDHRHWMRAIKFRNVLL